MRPLIPAFVKTDLHVKKVKDTNQRFDSNSGSVCREQPPRLAVSRAEFISVKNEMPQIAWNKHEGRSRCPVNASQGINTALRRNKRPRNVGIGLHNQ